MLMTIELTSGEIKELAKSTESWRLEMVQSWDPAYGEIDKKHFFASVDDGVELEFYYEPINQHVIHPYHSQYHLIARREDKIIGKVKKVNSLERNRHYLEGLYEKLYIREEFS